MMFVSARSLASLVVCLGAAAGAHGQCNVYRWNVPDFDQKRNGLPGDGGMYCLPTSATNWMAYIANHGYPPMMAGPRDWPNQSNYSLVTATDSLMGSLMGTTTAGGTNGAGGLIGLQAYMFPRGPFLFTTTAWFGTISPLDMWVQMQTNGLVDICYGYFIPLPGPSGNFYGRNGGHCVTLNGVENICAPAVHPTIRMRNPADDANLSTQSPFATEATHGILETFPTAPIPGYFSTLTRLEDFGGGSSTRRYIDSMYVVRANFNCWAPAGSVPEMHLSKTVSLFGDPQPQNATFTLPPGSVASAIAVHPDQSKVAYVLSTPMAGGISHQLHLLNLGTSADLNLGVLLSAANDKTPIAFDRFGRLITCDGSVLKVMDVTDRVPLVVASRQLEAGASSICFDDVHDEVVVLTPGNRRLIRCSMDLATWVREEPLPAGVPAMGDGSVTPDPTNQRYLITIVGDNSVRELSLIPGSSQLTLSSTLLLPAVQSIQDIQPADAGGFYALCDGSVRVLDRDPADGRLRTSPERLFNTLPAMRCMSISRSRTNYDPALHSGPAWVNLPNPDEGVASVVDCRGDYNLNGRVDVQDIFAFLAGWFANDPHADVNDSASLTVQDIFDFLAAWFAGC